MKKLLINITVYLLLMFILIMAVFYSANGSSIDRLYLKFTTNKKNSLILGTSKAAEGLQPKIINEILGRDDIYNYAFTLDHSPFGPAYLRSIYNKLNKSNKDGVFIITVDPYSISIEKGKTDKSINFKENEYAVGMITNVNTFPNYDYLIHHYPHQYFYLLAPNIKLQNPQILHNDGWYESNLSMDEKMVEFRTNENVSNYTRLAHDRKYSEVRFNYLKKIIKLLSNYGHVYIVRLPVIEPLLKLENSVIPDFDLKIQNLCSKYNLCYLNLTSNQEKYSFLDGNHLNRNTSSIVSKEVATWINTSKCHSNFVEGK